MNRPRWCCVGVVALMFVAGLGALAAPCTIIVQPGESIQEAIDAASPGDVICLAEGEWRENIVIAKSLTVRGQGASSTTIQGLVVGREGAEEPVVSVQQTAEVVTIEGLTLADGKGFGGYGLIAKGASEVRVLRCTVSANARHGVAVTDDALVTIQETAIVGNGWHGVLAVQNARITIIECHVSENGASDDWSGIALGDDARTEIVNSTIVENAGSGVVLGVRARAELTGCTLDENGLIGIVVGRLAQATLTDCTISGNKRDGIQLWGAPQVLIATSTIAANSRNGLTLRGRAQATLANNQIMDNGSYGVALVERPCFAMDELFTGYVTGRENTSGGNADGDYCPDALAFLFTEEGGELDRREEE